MSDIDAERLFVKKMLNALYGRTVPMKEAKRRRKQGDAEIRQRVRKVTKGHE